MNNLTAVIPFFNGQQTIGRLLDSLPDRLPVIIVDDHSDEPLQIERPGVRVIRPEKKGFFSGAVNAGLAACTTDALILNQDAWLQGDAWVNFVSANRGKYALIGEGVFNHPAWPNGYVQGTFMYVRRDAWGDVGPLNARDYPLWGSTCEWQLRACRAGYRALPVPTVPGLQHEHGGRFGSAITEAMERWPKRKWLFLRTPPRVSVIMPCFNYGRYLPEAINSLIGGPTSLGEMPGQTLQSFEIIIVDDASTDGETPAVIDSMVDHWQGIRAIRLTRNRGTAGAINAGINVAYGRYINILSADDLREPWALDSLYRTCERHPNSVAYNDVRVFAHGQRLKTIKLAKYDFDELLYKNCMPAGIMYPRAAWEAVGGYPEQMKWGREDWAFNVNLGINGYCGIKVAGETGNLYRREKQNRSLRNQGPTWHKHFLSQLRGLYPDIYEGSRPMGCCGGRGAKPRKGKVPMIDKNLPGKDGFELLEYVGGRTGSTTWWGPATGTSYRFGDNDRNRVGYVDAKDVPGLLKMMEGRAAVFRRLPPAVDAELNLPTAEAERINPGVSSGANGKGEAIEVLPEDTTDGILDAGELLELASVVLTEKEVSATKAARNLARDMGLDLNNISGTGKGGRVTLGDVKEYANA